MALLSKNENLAVDECHLRNDLRKKRERQQALIDRTTQWNREALVESRLELASLVKKDGKITLKASFDKSGSIEARLQVMQEFEFRIDCSRVAPATLTLQVDLSSYEEMNWLIKNSKSMD